MLLAQANESKLRELCNKSDSKDGALSVTVEDVAEAMRCLEPAHPDTAESFCLFMFNLAEEGRETTCALILSANVVPVLFNSLRAWLKRKEVVVWACCALYTLFLYGGTAAVTAITSVPDFEVLLKSTAASGLDEDFGNAAELLSELSKDA